MKQKQNLWGYGVIVFTLIFISSSVIFKIFDFGALPSQFFGALIGVVITAIITVFLLQGQTANEEEREKSVKVFEKKQEVYHTFLEEFKKIIQDGEITIVSKGKDANLDKSVDELKDLIFQLGYLQMHTSEKTINVILDSVAKLIQLMNDFNSTQETDKQKELPNYYSSFSEELFKIIAILKEDLYNDECKPISKDKMNSILKECGLFVETEGFDRYEIQKYFWDEIQKQLQGKGYKIEQKDFTQDISQYYARVRNRHRYYGFGFPVYTSNKSNRKVLFHIELENSYFYGFAYEDNPYSDVEISSLISEISNSFSSNKYWAGWKWSDRFNLDFWNLNSPGFESLKNPRKRESYLKGIVEEMEMYIKKFQQLAKERNL
jgi:gas vesicle protein